MMMLLNIEVMDNYVVNNGMYGSIFVQCCERFNAFVSVRTVAALQIPS